jgi:cellulose biosynthesis protein BcsQ
LARKRITSGTAPSQPELALLDSARAFGSHAACFFNNKGGVGKTTLVANLAAELALNFGAKILVVDGDPQCNLTQYVLTDEDSLEIYSSTDPSSVYSVIRPLSLGKGYGDSLPLRTSSNFGFDVIVGDPRLALQEDLLSSDWRDAKGGGMRGIRTTYVFADLVGKAKSMKYDFIFFDMGPSLGGINRSILLAMDYFVVPMSIDIFSSWAIKNIGTAVTTWQKELRTGITLAEDPREIPSVDQSKSIRFLGYVTQQHKERARETIEDGEVDPGFEYSQIETTELATNSKKTRLVEAYERINSAFPEQITSSLGAFYDQTSIDPHLGNIRHLASLAPMSQSQHTPMISVRGKGSYNQLRKQARDIYRSIAIRYLENLNQTVGLKSSRLSTSGVVNS